MGVVARFCAIRWRIHPFVLVALALMPLGIFKIGERVVTLVELGLRQVDLFSLSEIRGVVLRTDPVPLAPDGKIDVYKALQGSTDDPDLLRSLCSSERKRGGPSYEMIKAGDYSRFPFERARGPVRRDDADQMLFWDPEPDHYGVRLVAFCGGRVEEWPEAKFQRLLGVQSLR